MNGQGPDPASYDRASATKLHPHEIQGRTTFMFETRLPGHPMRWATNKPTMQLDYDGVWSGFIKAQLP